MIRLRDIIPLWRLERPRTQTKKNGVKNGGGVPNIDTSRPTQYDGLLKDIADLPEDWHAAGVCFPPPLRATASLAPARVAHSAETGCGKSTLLMSHLSQHHTVFSLDDSGTSNSLKQVRESPLLRKGVVEFVLGPTQQTLPRHDFQHRLDLAFIDGPHGYPFPELEYYFLYPHLAEDALLVVDDIHIPTIFRLFAFLREDSMFDYLGIVSTTAFFRRNASDVFDPYGDGWWAQQYNRKRFPVSDFTGDYLPPDAPYSRAFQTIISRTR